MLLYDRGGGAVRGFTMPKATGHQTIHHLYSPKSRASSFPEADFRFLVHVGMNLARAFDRLHASDCVIGDVNYGNVLVSSKATVRLIDCDSFQVRSPTGWIFRCEVGSRPLCRRSCKGSSSGWLIADPDHDAFGLAILIFHLLFQGRHPFAGRFQGPDPAPFAGPGIRRIRSCRIASAR